MELEHIRLFMQVARAGSFTTAARERGISSSSVSRAVQALEDALGTRLLHRTTRAIALTQAGELFLSLAVPALEELERAAEEVRGLEAAPSGHLRMTASVSFGNAVVAPLLPGFRERHPGITVELLLSDALVDVVGQGIDLAIRHGSLAESSLVATKLLEVEYVVVASSRYLEEHGTPADPAELSSHELLNYSLPGFRQGWRLTKGNVEQQVAVAGGVVSSNAETLRQCALNSMGIALLADWLVRGDLETARLRRIFPDWSAHGAGMRELSKISLVRPSKAFTPAKVTAFVEFLSDHIRPAGSTGILARGEGEADHEAVSPLAQ